MNEEERSKAIEAVKITQEILNCDNWIAKLTGDTFLQYGWIKKKEEAEKKLKELQK